MNGSPPEPPSTVAAILIGVLGNVETGSVAAVGTVSPACVSKSSVHIFVSTVPAHDIADDSSEEETS